MFISSLIFDSVVIQLLFSSVFLIFIFYSLGKILQNQFSFKKYNSFVSIPLGFVFYFVITQSVYTFAILVGVPSNFYSILEIIKNTAILISIIFFYKSWAGIFKINLYNTKNSFYGLFSILLAMLLFWIATKYDNGWLMPENSAYNLTFSIYKINNGLFNTKNINGVANTVTQQYNSFYYWIYSVSSIANNGDVTIDMINYVQNYLVTFIFIFVIVTSINSVVINVSRNWFYFMFSLMLSILLILIMGKIGNDSLYFYTFPFIIIALSESTSYIKQASSDEKSINFALFSLIGLSTVIYSPTLLFLIFGAFIIFIVLSKEGNLIQAILNYLLIIIIWVLIDLLLIFLYDPELLPKLILYIIAIILIVTLLILPIYSLIYSQSKKKDLYLTESSIFSKKRIYIIFVSTSVTLISLIYMIIFGISFNTIKTEYFDVINKTLWISIILYFSLLLIPSIIIIYFNGWNYKDAVLSFATFVFVFNPITITALYSLANVEVTIYVIIAPIIIMPIIELILLTSKIHKKIMRL